MKKICWSALILLVLTLPGFSLPVGKIAPSVYINNQASVPNNSLFMDSQGVCWVDSAYVPLSSEENQKLNGSGLEYKSFYQGKAYLDLMTVADCLGWQTKAGGNDLFVYTSSYKPLQVQSYPPASPGGGQPSQTMVIQKPADTKTDVNSPGSFSLPPYMYYYSGPSYSPVNNGLDYPGNYNYFGSPAADW